MILFVKIMVHPLHDAFLLQCRSHCLHEEYQDLLLLLLTLRIWSRGLQALGIAPKAFNCLRMRRV